MATGEDQAQLVVSRQTVGGQVRSRQIREIGAVALLDPPSGLSTQRVDRFAAGHEGEPGSRLAGNTGPRPLPQRGHDRVLYRVFGHRQAANRPNQRRQDARTLDPDGFGQLVDRVDHVTPR